MEDKENNTRCEECGAEFEFEPALEHAKKVLEAHRNEWV